MMHFMTDEDIQRTAPSVFADAPDAQRSDRYVFVSSRKIVDSMRDNGWGVSRVRTPNVRVASPQHCRHELVFRNRDVDLGFADPRIPTYGDYKATVTPEIRVENSHDGSCRIKYNAGLFAQICSNGLTINLSDMGSFSSKHLGFDSEEAYKLTTEFTSRVPQFVEAIDEFSGIHLGRDQQLAFASKARDLRWAGDRASMVDPADLLNSRRPQDDGDDLWRIYNRVQENLIRGGFSSINTKRQVRPIQNIKLDNQINSDLWALAESYCLN